MLAASAARYGNEATTTTTTTSPIESSPSIESIKLNLRRKLRVNAGTNTARALASLPPNVLNPATYTSLIRDMADHYGWELKEWTMDELDSIGCGAFTAVTQGNGPNSSDRMIRITRPAKDSATNTGTVCRY